MLDLAQQIDYIYERIEPSLIRDLANLSDESIKISVLVMICEITRGIRAIPSKAHKTKLAKSLLKAGCKSSKIAELTGLSMRSIYRLRKEM